MKFFIFLILLMAVAGGLWYLNDRHGLGYLRFDLSEREDPATAQRVQGWQPPAMPAATPLAVSGTVMKWTLDGRWERGLDAGERGLALIEFANHDHFEVKGDPFLFRSRKEEAAALLTQAIGELSSLRDSFAGDAAAQLDISPLLRKYEEGLAKTPRR